MKKIQPWNVRTTNFERCESMNTRKTRHFASKLNQKSTIVNKGLDSLHDEWSSLKFKRTTSHQSLPHGYWKERTNHKKYFDELGHTLGINNLDDWYEKLSRTVLLANNGGSLLNTYNGSPMAALMAVYPDHNWIPWMFKNVPSGFWQSKDNQRKFFDWVGKRLDIKQLDDWYEKLSKKTLEDFGASCLLKKYNGSPIAALMASYPEHNWIPWKFKSSPQRFWKDVSNQRKYFDYLGHKLGIQQLDDWYQKLTKNVLTENDGNTLVDKYHNGSPTAALMTAYPEHNWIPWKFNSVPQGYWKSKDNVSKFLAELSDKLSIQTLDDWYRVDHVQLHKFGATLLLMKYKGLYALLKEYYPHHPWDPKRFQHTSKKAQRWLVVTLKKLFPEEGIVYCMFKTNISEILEDYMHPKVVFATSKRPVQLDVFIPSKSLAFEYQGIQHYQEVGLFNPTRTYQQRDEEKRTLCAANNIKLIEIPYWWNRTQESLQEMIK